MLQDTQTDPKKADKYPSIKWWYFKLSLCPKMNSGRMIKMAPIIIVETESAIRTDGRFLFKRHSKMGAQTALKMENNERDN